MATTLFDLVAKLTLDAASFTKGVTGAVGKGAELAKKMGGFVADTAAAALDMTKNVALAAGTIYATVTTVAVKHYAEYEQLVGGVETLFKDSADKVQEYAANAYKTAGMSANEYMSTVTSFSASLLQSLGGDTNAAAEYANQALTDMSDNANKMGTSMEMIQNAYQGFAKQNYTMLDNLKLGYGGTKEEMARLIEDAAKLSDTVDAQDMSFENIVKAINVVQTEMGITGTTAKEAGATIAGSVGAMKSAWSNLITGLADGNADIGKLVDNLVTTIVGDGTESNLGVLGNVMPAVKTALTGASNLVSELLPKIVQEVPAIINDNLPILAEAAISIIQSLVDGISENQEMLMTTAFETIVFLANSLISMLPQIVALGLDLIVSLANGIAESLPELIPTIMDVILQIVDTLTNPANLTNLLNASLVMLMELANGLVDAIPQLVDAINQIVMNIGWFLTDPKNIGMILEAALKIVVALGKGVLNAIPVFLENFATFYSKIFENFKNVDWGELGKNIVDGLLNGLKNAWETLTNWFSDAWDGLVGGVKDLLGIHSPSRVFAGIGKNMALGVGEGWEDEFGDIQGDIDKSLAFDDPSMSINASIRKVCAGAAGMAYGGTSIGNITINIDGAKYSDEQSLASAIAQEIQNMTDRRAAVYA